MICKTRKCTNKVTKKGEKCTPCKEAKRLKHQGYQKTWRENNPEKKKKSQKQWLKGKGKGYFHKRHKENYIPKTKRRV